MLIQWLAFERPTPDHVNLHDHKSLINVIAWNFISQSTYYKGYESDHSCVFVQVLSITLQYHC